MKKLVIIEYKPGSNGLDGRDGRDGTSVYFPISAYNVQYTPDGRTVEQVLTQLLYVPLVINSFTTPQVLFEKGQSIASLTFSWSYNKAITVQSIAGTHVVPPSLSASDRSKSVSFSGLENNGSVITLTADDGSGTINAVKTANVSVNFFSKIHYGAAAIPGVINDAFISALTGALASSKAKQFTVDLGVGIYGWFVSPISMGVPSFNINGFSGGMTDPVVVSYTNSYGFTEQVYVSRTINSNLGTTTIEAI